MLSEAIGSTLALGLAVALSPFPVIAIVLILAGRDGRRNGALFALGWVVGLSVVAALVVLLLGDADNPESTASAFADWLRVLAGLALIGLGVRKWVGRPRRGEEVAPPGWMASVEGMTPSRSAVLGLLLAGANPKNVVLTASAVAAIIEADVHGADLLTAVAVFVVLGSCSVLGAVLAHLVGGARAATGLDGVRQFMVANSAVIMVVVLLLMGASVLGGGLEGLGR
jgi:threonine/homoserine/homoserine lactone efflux protein